MPFVPEKNVEKALNLCWRSQNQSRNKKDRFL